MNNLIELLPEHLKSTAMRKLQGILTGDINKLTCSLKKTIDECFVNTSSEILSRYEKIYGLNIDVSKSDAFRRERIKAKIRGIGTITKQMIIDTAAVYSNGEVEVIEDPANYSFTIKFTGNMGIPANISDLTQTIEEIKPAHLSFLFEYVYITWDTVEKYNKAWDTWDALNLTWDEFEKYKEA